MLTIMDISQTPEIVRYEGETLVALIKAQVEKPVPPTPVM